MSESPFFLAILSLMNCDHMFMKVGKELAQKIEFISYKSPNALTLPVHYASIPIEKLH